MTVLVDTNILLRTVDRSSTEHQICIDALRKLDDLGGTLVICAQVMIEFWSVSTRLTQANGMGLDASVAGAALDGFVASMPVLAEVPDMAPRWRRVVDQFSVISKQAHDARLVALMDAHGINQLLTLNRADFTRFNHISILTPVDVIALANP